MLERRMLGRGGLIAEIDEVTRTKGTQKTRGYFGVFYAMCIGVYWYTWK